MFKSIYVGIFLDILCILFINYIFMDFVHTFSNVPVSGVFSLMSGGVGAILGGFLITFFLIIVLILVPFCFVFQKAGRAWWEALIPLYNLYVLTIITGQPAWYLIGFFIPVLNWITSIYLYYQLSKRFGYGIPFAVGLVLLPFVFLPILGFGTAVYSAPVMTEPQADASSSVPQQSDTAPVETVA